MLFVEFRFFIFFAIVLSAYWLLKSHDHRKTLLLFASYYFYGSWDWRFAVMLCIISGADYYFALKIHQTPTDTKEHKRFRRLLVTLSLAMNLGILAYFKYFNFFAGSAIALANSVGMHLSPFTLHVILPVGVSFFTFQSLSYTIDVYRKDIEPVYKLRDYLMFAAFFPQLVAGPIVRPHYFMPQMATKRTITPPEVRHYLTLFLLGYVKKACIADNISPYVDRVFLHPQAFDHASSVSAIWLYAVQIFCDFSGYSDMAIAVAGLLGFKLVLNFDAPYLSLSIQDFWRRWHISLSNWIRDYIYISLGGRSEKRWTTYRNLMITMLAGGLWHGASWNFVIWGGLHGLGLVVQRAWRHRFKPKDSLARIYPVIGWALNLNFVCCCWILFRATSFETAGVLLRRYLLFEPGGAESLPQWLILLPIGLLALQFSARHKQVFEKIVDLRGARFALAYGCFWSIAISLLPFGSRPFIYFQF